MIFKGRINRLLPLKSGTKEDGSEWKRQEYVFEYYEKPDDRYADRVVVSAMGNRIDEYDLHEGDEVEIGFGHNVKEYQGRWYNEISMYHCKKLKAAPTSQQPQIMAGQAPDDLPFL